MPSPGVWLITCPTHGHIGAAIHMARDLADEIAAHHNHQPASEKRAPMTTPEHLPDDIAAADKAVEQLLDALSVLRDHDLPKPAAALCRDAQAQALGVWGIVHLDFPKMVRS